jgi:hypothetical protein
MEMQVAIKGICHTIENCTAGTPSVVAEPDGTPCGGTMICMGGNCVQPMMPPPSVGCSDGTREGFQDMNTYPGIAGCSGAWTVPGVTLPNLQPACGRASGNSSANVDGTGCSSDDLCASGWHVCRGNAEVALRAPNGCADAVPPGTPDKMLFFAVSQNSTMNTVCDSSSNDNDVFGCGNLGDQLMPNQMCGVLTRALASTQAGTCGFNEAEPPLGPWECMTAMSRGDLHEGAIVTKKACVGNSCSYNGSPIGPSDKGGVLCCVD